MVTVSGMMISRMDVQFAKALEPMLFTVEASATDLRFTQPLNIEPGRIVHPSAKTTFSSFTQSLNGEELKEVSVAGTVSDLMPLFWNADVPSLLTDAGNAMPSSATQFRNALSGISVSDSESSTDLSCAQSANTCLPSVLTVSGITKDSRPEPMNA